MIDSAEVIETSLVWLHTLKKCLAVALKDHPDLRGFRKFWLRFPRNGRARDFGNRISYATNACSVDVRSKIHRMREVTLQFLSQPYDVVIPPKQPNSRKMYPTFT
jgi:hypothetical protein